MSDKQVRSKYTLEYKMKAVHTSQGWSIGGNGQQRFGHPQGQSKQLGAPDYKRCISGADDKAVPVTAE